MVKSLEFFVYAGEFGILLSIDLTCGIVHKKGLVIVISHGD